MGKPATVWARYRDKSRLANKPVIDGLVCGECGCQAIVKHPEFPYALCRNCWWICDLNGKEMDTWIISRMIRRRYPSRLDLPPGQEWAVG